MTTQINTPGLFSWAFGWYSSTCCPAKICAVRSSRGLSFNNTLEIAWPRLRLQAFVNFFFTRSPERPECIHLAQRLLFLSGQKTPKHVQSGSAGFCWHPAYFVGKGRDTTRRTEAVFRGPLTTQRTSEFLKCPVGAIFFRGNSRNPKCCLPFFFSV